MSFGIAHAIEIHAPKVALQGVSSSLTVTGARPGAEVVLLAGTLVLFVLLRVIGRRADAGEA